MMCRFGVARSGGGNADEHLSWAGVGDRHVVQHGRLLPLEELICPHLHALLASERRLPLGGEPSGVLGGVLAG
jgi:hypothetical protein